MEDNLCNLTLFGDVVVSFCAATFSVAKSCMLLKQLKRSVSCNLDLEGVISSLPQLALVSDGQVSNKEASIAGDDDVQQAVIKFVDAVEELNFKHCIDVWETPGGFPIMQTFPLDILYHL